MDKKKALPLSFSKQFRMTSGSSQPEERIVNLIDEKPIWTNMQFPVSLPVADQTMISILHRNFRFFKKHLNDFRKKIHPLALCFHFFKIFQKMARSIKGQHSLLAAESNSWKLENFRPLPSSNSFIASMVSLLGTYVLKGMSRSLTSLVKVIRTKSDMERPIAERISLASDFNSLSRRTRIKESAVLIKAPFKQCLHCSTNSKKLIFGLLALLPIFCQADEFGDLAKRCAPTVAEDTLRAIVKTESGFNPYAIGVVNGKVKQPRTYHEAMSTIAELELSGADYSVGLAQLNQQNFQKYGISASQALDACTNLRVAAQILGGCFKSAKQSPASEGKALHDALSCYYSGNFKTGYRHGYVDKVRSNAGLPPLSVPSIRELDASKPQSLIAEGVPGKSSGLIF